MEVVQVMFENHATDLIGDIGIDLLCGDNSYISIEHLVSATSFLCESLIIL